MQNPEIKMSKNLSAKSNNSPKKKFSIVSGSLQTSEDQIVPSIIGYKKILEEAKTVNLYK